MMKKRLNDEKDGAS